ncbi:MAG: nickel-dependent lactate racemase [Deltaproteobacteria bacterium]|nr:nickel-dependent lactate racemase [Deltaproteobacteria bacterium]
MHISLLYGKKELSVNLPDDIVVDEINKHPMPLLKDPAGAVMEAFIHPVNALSLPELARGKRNACILICDITRPVPNGVILPALVESLVAAGISRENILILVATGLHRPNEGDELRELIDSEDIFSSMRIENHFARDQAAHVDLGTTSQGIPIGIDRRFAEADLRVVTGLVEPHFMAGYSGGRKVVAPGVAYQDTILTFHTAHILEHSRATNCVMDGNPLHQAQLEIIKKIGAIYAINVVIDDKRRLGLVNFGEIEQSHLKAVKFLQHYAEVDISRKYRTIVTSAGGYPLDKTYYQTVKGMVGPLEILEPGGTIIIASECSEGMGSDEFISAQKLLCQKGPSEFMDILNQRSKALIDEWQTEMLLKPLKQGNIKLFTSSLTADQLEQTYVETVTSLEQAVVDSVRDQKSNTIAVIPEGPYVVPHYHQS